MTTRSEAVFAVTLVFFLLATVFVGMRMVSRLAIVKKVDWDDGLMGVAWVSSMSWRGPSDAMLTEDRSTVPRLLLVLRDHVCGTARSWSPGCW